MSQRRTAATRVSDNGNIWAALAQPAPGAQTKKASPKKGQTKAEKKALALAQARAQVESETKSLEDAASGWEIKAPNRKYKSKAQLRAEEEDREALAKADAEAKRTKQMQKSKVATRDAKGKSNVESAMADFAAKWKESYGFDVELAEFGYCEEHSESFSFFDDDYGY